MTTTANIGSRGPALPSVRASVVVPAPVERAFDIFVSQFGRWWPLATHSIAADEDLSVRAVDARIEPIPNGRILEVWSDGQEVSWGTVLVCEPPSRLVLAWNPNRTRIESTEVEVRFRAQGSATLVELEHRGWERLGAQAAASRAGYEAGWSRVLGRFAAQVETS